MIVKKFKRELNKEVKIQNQINEKAEDIEFEVQEIRYKIQELRKEHSKDAQNMENYKADLFTNLSESRDQFILKRDQDEQYIVSLKEKIGILDTNFRKRQNYSEELSKCYNNAKLKVTVSMKSLKSKNKILEEMMNEGKVKKKVKSPGVVNNITKILSTEEINKRFQKLCKEGNKFRLKQNYS
mmetsp:Transcript_1449/g.1590  ORF Transcript_1449/g.1590 Transcript_1449/m.1590 type:complete len:183 (-) Transcript_1449:44-592(-)